MQTQHGTEAASTPERKPAAIPESIDATLELLGAADYVADRSLATVAVPGAEARPPAVPRRRGGRRQDRDRQGPGRDAERPLIRLQCYEGLDVASAVYEWNYAAPDDRDPPRRGAGRASTATRLAHDIFAERFLIRRPLLQALEPDRRRRAGPADRRARPHRRAVRGLSARGAVRLPGDDSRARHGQGGAAADRHHHLEPHARDPRRAEAPLPLSLGRLSRPASASSRSCSVKAPGAPKRLSREVVAFVQQLRKLDLFKSPGVAETIDWATALAELDALALDPGASTTRSACCSNTRTTSPRSRARRQSSSSTKCSRNCAPHAVAAGACTAPPSTMTIASRRRSARQARRKHPAFRPRAARGGPAGRAGQRCRRDRARSKPPASATREDFYGRCMRCSSRSTNIASSSIRRSRSSGARRGFMEKLIAPDVAASPTRRRQAPKPKAGARARRRGADASSGRDAEAASSASKSTRRFTIVERSRCCRARISRR